MISVDVDEPKASDSKVSECVVEIVMIQSTRYEPCLHMKYQHKNTLNAIFSVILYFMSCGNLSWDTSYDQVLRMSSQVTSSSLACQLSKQNLVYYAFSHCLNKI